MEFAQCLVHRAADRKVAAYDLPVSRFASFFGASTVSPDGAMAISTVRAYGKIGFQSPTPATRPWRPS